MQSGMLEKNETMLTKEHIKKYLSKIATGTLTPEDLEFIFVSMSEEGQNSFLDGLKEVFSREDWEAIVMHLKSYDYAMLGEFRQKTRLAKENMAIAMYNHFNEVTDGN